MVTSFGEIEVLHEAEVVADDVWKLTLRWNGYARDVVGKQLARAADSVGANIAEAFGRYHFGEKLNFLYYARGSLYETKYWLNRAYARQLLQDAEIAEYSNRLEQLARRLNAFAKSIRTQKRRTTGSTGSTREPGPTYDTDEPLFTETDLSFLSAIP